MARINKIITARIHQANLSFSAFICTTSATIPPSSVRVSAIATFLRNSFSSWLNARVCSPISTSRKETMPFSSVTETLGSEKSFVSRLGMATFFFVQNLKADFGDSFGAVFFVNLRGKKALN